MVNSRILILILAFALSSCAGLSQEEIERYLARQNHTPEYNHIAYQTKKCSDKWWVSKVKIDKYGLLVPKVLVINPFDDKDKAVESCKRMLSEDAQPTKKHSITQVDMCSP